MMSEVGAAWVHKQTVVGKQWKFLLVVSCKLIKKLFVYLQLFGASDCLEN